MGVLIFVAGAMAGAGLGVMVMAVLQIARDASGNDDEDYQATDRSCPRCKSNRAQHTLTESFCPDCGWLAS